MSARPRGAFVASAAAAFVGGAAYLIWSLRNRTRERANNNGDDAEDTIDQLRAKLATATAAASRATKLRGEERTGRIRAEKKLRALMQGQPAPNAAAATAGGRNKQKKADAPSYTLKAIGRVRSMFGERRGTPRQGSLAPATRCTLRLAKHVPPSALDGLEQFSHAIVLFYFHKNTNLHGTKTTCRAKVAPPLLGGKKVGLFATRSPHRPNAIGLTVVAVRAVDVASRSVELGGVDFVDGTPVLDLKPLVPADLVGSAPAPGVRFARWVPTTGHHVGAGGGGGGGDDKPPPPIAAAGASDGISSVGTSNNTKKRPPPARVKFAKGLLDVRLSAAAERQLLRLWQAGAFTEGPADRPTAARGPRAFYRDLGDLRSALTEVLRLDVRSVHKGRGQSGRDGEEEFVLASFAGMAVKFRTFLEKGFVEVTQVETAAAPPR